jgi:hypothetical protein
METNRAVRRGCGATVVGLIFIASACGGGDDSADVAANPDDATAEVATAPAQAAVDDDTTPPDTSSANDESTVPSGSGLGSTGACDRVTPAELSDAFGVTFEGGAEIADGQCLFNSDGPPQFLLAIYPGSPTVCETLGSGLETVEVAGNSGWWDEAGAQARVCLPDGSIAAILSGGGGDNSIHRDAVVGLLALAVTR